jgi:hypothetical protein
MHVLLPLNIKCHEVPAADGTENVCIYWGPNYPKDVHWTSNAYEVPATDAQKIWRDTTTAAADQTYYYGRKKMD